MNRQLINQSLKQFYYTTLHHKREDTLLTGVEIDNNRGGEYNKGKMKLSYEAYKNVADTMRLLHDELKVQISPSVVVLKSNQLPQSIPESRLKEALKYLAQEKVITYNCEIEYSPLFYEYNKEYREAKEALDTAEYFFAKDDKSVKAWGQINLLDKQRKAEAERSGITTFKIKPLTFFEQTYEQMAAEHNSFNSEHPHDKSNKNVEVFREKSITSFPLRLHCEISPNVNDNSLQDITIFINNIKIRAMTPSTIGNIAKYAFSKAIPDSGIFTTIDINKIGIKYQRNMSSLIRDFLDSELLGRIFFEKIPRSKHSFKMRTEVTKETLEELEIDTVQVLNEIERLSKKRKRNIGK